MSETRPLWKDGFERIDATTLLAKHRASECDRGDMVRAIATLEEKLADLTERLQDMMEANDLWSGR